MNEIKDKKTKVLNLLRLNPNIKLSKTTIKNVTIVGSKIVFKNKINKKNVLFHTKNMFLVK